MEAINRLTRGKAEPFRTSGGGAAGLDMTKPATYADAGVDIDAANRATERIREFARTTFNGRTLSDIGSFGGMFDGAFPRMREPVLVASADGVGTKLKIAFATG